MALKKLEEFSNTDGSRRAVVYRDSKAGEFRVEFWINGEFVSATFFGNWEQADATESAEAFCLPAMLRAQAM